jgi:hypothetical protein
MSNTTTIPRTGVAEVGWNEFFEAPCPIYDNDRFALLASWGIFFRKHCTINDARKLRLLGCAVLRTWHVTPEAATVRAALDVAERFADRRAGSTEMKEADRGVRDAFRTIHGYEVQQHDWDLPRPPELLLLSPLDLRDLNLVFSEAGRWLSVAARDNYHRWLLNCVADLFGVPFRTHLVIPPAWLDWRGRTVPALARRAYVERHLPSGTLDNDRLGILSDALEEAGCADTHILTHLRSGREHYRGCLVVDALLGLY